MDVNGSRIRLWIEHNRLKIQDLVRCSGISKPSIYNILNGTTSEQSMQKIYKHLGASSVSELIYMDPPVSALERRQEIANRLRSYRESYGVDQDQIWNMTSISIPRYTMLESATDLPTDEELQKLARVYGVSIEDLLCRSPRVEEQNTKNDRWSDLMYSTRVEEVNVVHLCLLDTPPRDVGNFQQEAVGMREWDTATEATQETHFLLRITDEDMYSRDGDPYLPPGSIVCVDTTITKPVDRWTVLVDVDGKSLLRIYRTGSDPEMCILESPNRNYPPIIRCKKEIRILGVVVGRQYSMPNGP